MTGKPENSRHFDEGDLVSESLAGLAKSAILSPCFFLFFLVSLITRIILVAVSFREAGTGVLEIAGICLIGVISDAAFFSAASVPFLLVAAVLPTRILSWWMNSLARRVVFAFFAYGILFIAVSEVVFWEEFGCRFNFIAVDYLVYTNEVVGNIWESYPMIPILGGVLLIALGATRLFRPLFDRGRTRTISTPSKVAAVIAAFFLGVGGISLSETLSVRLGGNNRFVRELARNGPERFIRAFLENTIEYERFYPVVEAGKIAQRLGDFKTPGKVLGVGQPSQGGISLSSDMNVVILMEESMSAEFMGEYGHKGGLTPNLDSLAGKSVFMSRCYATGTRTVRGMEAVVLSIPPTPGRAIVKRPLNGGLDSLGELFLSRGYRTQFIYSGYGYFDNMSDFFGNNGFEVIDRSNLGADEITFGNIWGVCDEDILGRALREMDSIHSSGARALQFIMTTSNHRPYTYPEGRIDIPSGTGGRSGGVKYADFAIGKYLDQARSRPWFRDTVYIIVADHCASSSGKADLPVHRYRIPLLFYSPGNLEPERIDKLCSQVDIGPTLLSMMGWRTRTSFFGSDILSPGFEPRAFIGNYQNLGLLKGDLLAILRPGRQKRFFRISNETMLDSAATSIPLVEELLETAVTDYQGASLYYETRAVPGRAERYSRYAPANADPSGRSAGKPAGSSGKIR